MRFNSRRSRVVARASYAAAPHWTVGLRLLLLFPLLACGLARAGAAPIAVTQGSDYDAERVDRHVRALSETIGARAAGTAGERTAAAYIAAQFTTIGLATEIQPFRVPSGTGSYTSANVAATKPGLDGHYGTIYLGAHYDSVPAGPGANDNASGTAVLLELARLLADQELKPTLVFIAFGAEEVGLRGSAAFVRQLTPLQRVTALGMLNMDCVGYGTRQIIATSPGAKAELVERTASIARSLGLEVEVGPNRGNSDHAPFASAGIPAAFVATRDAQILCGPYYHKPTDTVDTLDPAQMERVGRIVLATAENLAAGARLLAPTEVSLPSVLNSIESQVFATSGNQRWP